ncbi:TolC family protein [Candidatus Poribacteria bacterium]|nr:TolC family protein [Candidatus Poribacteria bacterium]
MSLRSGWLAGCLRPCLQLFAFVLAAAICGCIAYQPRPLVREDLIQTLDARSPSSVETAGIEEPPRTAEDGLSLEAAETIALFYNGSLRSARLRAQIPVVSANVAGRWDDPELGADVLRIMNTEPLQKPWILGSSLAFTLPVSGRLAVEKARAGAEARSALLEAWAAEQELLRELRVAWIKWQSASRAAEATRDLLARIEEVLEVTGRLEAAGELLAAEGMAFRLNEVRWRLDLQDLEAEEREAKLALVSLMGLPPAVEVSLEHSVPDYEAFALPDRGTLAARNPLIQVREAEYESAEQALRLEIRRQYPDIQLGPAYGREDGQNRAGFGFLLPLPILNANKQSIAEADAAREAARAAWEEAVHQALADSAAAESRLRAAERRRDLLQSTVVPLAESQLTEARRLAEQGEVNALLLLEALTARREAALDMIEADAALALERVAIRALAPPVPSELTANEPETPARKG